MMEQRLTDDARGVQCSLEARAPVLIPAFVEPLRLRRLLAVSPLPRVRPICRTTEEVLRSSDAEREDVVVIAPLFSEDGRPMTDELSRIATARPGVALVGIVSLTPRDVRELLAASLAGVTDVVIDGADDLSRVLVRAVAAAHARVVHHELASDEDISLAPVAREVLCTCLNAIHERPTVEVVAGALGMRPRTLSCQLLTANAPPIGTLISWSRILLAAPRLRASGASVERVALDLGLSSAAALQNLVRRHAGLTSRQLGMTPNAASVLRSLLVQWTRHSGNCAADPAGCLAACPPARALPHA